MKSINEIDELIKLISKLPGLGPKSAKRIVLKLINNKDELVKPMAKSLAEVYKNISRCKICGSLKPISIECSYTDCKILEKNYDKIALHISQNRDDLLKTFSPEHNIESWKHLLKSILA